MRFIAIIIPLLYTSSAIAQLSASLKLKPQIKDSVIYSMLGYNDYPDFKYANSTDIITSIPIKESAEKLWNNLDGMIKKPDERNYLFNYLKAIESENASEATHAKFYYRLANTFARLRLYPLAMKCFLKTIPKSANGSNIQSQPPPAIIVDTTLADTIATQNLSINSKDDSLINQQITYLSKTNLPSKSKAITYQRIRQTFDDGKKAVAYAMLFHVKQPVRGKRKIFVLSNVGHTFITLVKYNSDSTYTSVSLGFYPKKNNLLSATPLIPSTSSVFKDDAEHDWDEVLGKFISKKKFERIQGLILQYNGVKYNLSKNNCTDFGLKAAQLAGISLKETYGTWPLGRGNNPAITGQGILEHKFFNTGYNDTDHIFMDAITSQSQ